MGFSRKKIAESGEHDEFWRAMVVWEIESRRLVFVDECGANVSLVLLYAWSRRGERAPAKAPRNWGKNVTLLSSMSVGGMGASLAVEWATTREVFEAYLEGVLAPTLSPGKVVDIDNLSVHKGGRGREIIEERGCELIYLPPYSLRTSNGMRRSETETPRDSYDGERTESAEGGP